MSDKHRAKSIVSRLRGLADIIRQEPRRNGIASGRADLLRDAADLIEELHKTEYIKISDSPVFTAVEKIPSRVILDFDRDGNMVSVEILRKDTGAAS